MGARRLALGALLAGVVATVIVIAGSGGHHRLRASFASAINLVPGAEVRIAGRKVGSVGSVEEIDGRAAVGLNIEDSRAWPLPRGTIARIRYGSLTTTAGRYVELHPPAGRAPALPDGGILTTADTVTPVEFDETFQTFDAPTRRNVRALIRNLRNTLQTHRRDLATGLGQAGTGMQRLADMLGDVGADRHALHTLVTAGARTAGELRRTDPQLKGLIDHAAATFSEFADHARAQQQTLERFPAALDAGRRTLARLDRSLVGMDLLVRDIRPGAAGLRTTAPTVERVTRTLSAAAPVATAALTEGQRAAPSIERMLRYGTPFLDRTGSVVGDLAPMVACIRPYGPEIAGQMGTWAGFQGNFDPTAHYTRVVSQRPPFTAGTPLTSEQIVNEVFRNKFFYAMPRPPGLNAGQPWFLPECGAGRHALDVTKDPELKRSGG